MEDRDLIRHLEEGGASLFDRPQPPSIDVAAITGHGASRPARQRRAFQLRPIVAVGGAFACIALGVLGGLRLAPDAAPLSPPTPQAALPGAADPVPAKARQVALQRFANDAPTSALAQAAVFTSTNGRVVDFTAKGMKPAKRGEFYELWVLGDDGKMVSLGTVRVHEDGTAHARVPLPVSLHRFPVFDLSLEDGDGNPTHSGHSMLRSAAAA